MFIDSHCHLDCIDLKDFDHDFTVLMDSIQHNQVERMLCVSIDLDSYPHMREVVDSYESIDVSVGQHPGHVTETNVDVDTLVDLGQDQKVVAIGETGLDYFYGKDSKDVQQASFRTHIRAANQLKKPVIVHTRDAQEDTLEILKEENVSSCGGVLHCFTESWDMARQALDLGLYISFSGIVTFRNADALREVARKVPEDRLLIETDSPYLAPVPYRGKQNHPGLVQHVAECIAELRNTSTETVAKMTAENYRALFL